VCNNINVILIMCNNENNINNININEINDNKIIIIIIMK